jgi:hypothetical protein
VSVFENILEIDGCRWSQAGERRGLLHRHVIELGMSRGTTGGCGEVELIRPDTRKLDSPAIMKTPKEQSSPNDYVGPTYFKRQRIKR